MTNTILPEILKSGDESAKAVSIPDKYNITYSELRSVVSEISTKLNEFGTINEKNPQNVEYSLPYSQVLLKVGNLDKAAEVIIKCLKSNSSNPSLLTNLAIIKSELGDYKEAEVLY